MVIFPAAIIYILSAFGVGFLGRSTRIGAIGVTFLALIFSPLIMLIAVLLLRTADRRQPSNP